MYEETVGWIIKELTNFGEKLKGSRTITSYELVHKDFIKLTLSRSSSNIEFAIYIFPSMEVFSRKFNNQYETYETAYDIEEKKEVLQNLMNEAELLLTAKLVEDIYEKNGHVAYRTLHFPDGHDESSSPIFLGSLRRHFGYAKRTVHYN